MVPKDICELLILSVMHICEMLIMHPKFGPEAYLPVEHG